MKRHKIKKYTVTITETLQENISITAESEKEAVNIAKDRYEKGYISLDYRNNIDTKFNIKGK